MIVFVSKNTLGAVLGLTLAALTLGAGTAKAQTTNNLAVGPAAMGGALNNLAGVAGDAAPGFGGASFRGAATLTGAKSELVFTPAALFGRSVTMAEIERISYWTRKGTTHAIEARDWYLGIYTKPYTGDVSTAAWYGDRYGSEPYFSAAISDPANTWNNWTTDGASNRLRFFESTQGAPGATFGSYGDPDWDTFKGSNALSGQPRGSQEVLDFRISTASSWANGFTGRLDGFRVELTDGSVATVDFDLTVLWKGQQWDLPANGITTIDGAGNLNLTRMPGATGDVQVHLSRIAPLTGSDSFINQNGRPWVAYSYVDNGEYRGVDLFIEDETAVPNSRLQAGSLFACQGLGYVRFGPGLYPTSEDFAFAAGCDGAAAPGTIGSIRGAGQAHTIYAGQRNDGTVDYQFDGQWFSSTFHRDNGAAPFKFNDVYLRLRVIGNSATFTDFQYGDNHDVEPPVLTVPAPVTAVATGPSGAVVNYVASAIDNTDPSPIVSCTPASGSTFAVGNTLVTCTATDASGNTSAPQTFTVTVTRPVPASADQCKGGGWTLFARPNGTLFKNQGDCVSFVKTGK